MLFHVEKVNILHNNSQQQEHKIKMPLKFLQPLRTVECDLFD